jgi:hypothetical protein
MMPFCCGSFNRYTQIAARALHRCLKDEARVAAEKRGSTTLRYQQWKDGQGGVQVRNRRLYDIVLAEIENVEQTVLHPEEHHHPPGKPAV